MGFTLEKIVPWGRSFDEYINMFALTGKDLSVRILSCGDGPAAFNATLTKRGGSVVSVDPVYAFDAAQIQHRIAETCEIVMAQMHKNKNDYIWEDIPSVEALGKIRISAMEDFLADFANGKREGRYVTGELPFLPFENGQFDIALSSHFMFLYSAHLPVEFHIQAIREMLRVAREVRIFPLLTLDGALSPHFPAVNEYFSTHGFSVNSLHVRYEFQRGGNQMLVIRSA
ncbi:class I SAM-dependent methyltransferase [Nitrosomonas sp.]|uniref:class I SAM-dependent methyltransferase n=1 Tax=Nitrosomonas sp. TaxID=42353 RepID=UPI0025D7FA9D|nr:class I SAM-dependent methyltransferase [Nitrosomonas sp.]MCC6915906.1 class I SAM-dependent methyltransferase [Nitrosomonas sp.]